ncbi:hypothetical protein [Arenibaculum sp.]|uniref:hypothetical protein n=1 Tax=Arenibaculum sp. TaxID=2865862 RepID=UPI002E166A6A|nr:hypothetical protein [Arenibaculum sp.]
MTGAVLLAASAAWAGDGHNHGAAQRAIVVSPRAEVRLGGQEVVVTYGDGKLLVFLQRYVDGQPTVGAEVSATADFLPLDVQEIAPGIYASEPTELAGGRNEIEIAYTIDGRTETAAIPLTIPGGSAVARAAPTSASAGSVPSLALALAAACIFIAVNAVLMRRVRQA